MHKNYDIVIFSDFDNKNTSFIKFSDNSILLQKQINVIDDCFIKSNITFVCLDADQKKLKYSGQNKFRVLKIEKETGGAKIMERALKSTKYSKVILLYNNIFLDSDVFNKSPEKTSIYINNRKQGNLSIVQNEGSPISNMFWNVGIEWSKIICFITNKDIDLIKDAAGKCNKNQFMFEAINKAIDNGLNIDSFKHNGLSINIDKRNDVKNVENFIGYK